MKDTQLTIRINSELKKQATVVAESQSRTIGNLIEYLLKQEIEKAAQKRAVFFACNPVCYCI
jgi:antitoxin component of RelBE/YafQ-DinJ toxin-antitoxin module